MNPDNGTPQMPAPKPPNLPGEESTVPSDAPPQTLGQPQAVPMYIPHAQQSHRSTLNRVLLAILSVIIVIGGLVVGFFIGFSISFGSCYKSQCSPVESSAMLWAPAASLLVTIPVAVKLNAPRD